MTPPGRTAGTARVGDLDLRHEAWGDPDRPTLLLVNGFGAQLTDWDPAWCSSLMTAGFHVICYDHRDSGLSTRLEHLDESPDPVDRAGLAYGLEDLADDGINLLQALGVERAHVLGTSMGGMIAQQMAIRHPTVVASLCSVMSSTGAPEVGRPQPGLLARMAAPVPANRSSAAEQAVRAHHLVGGIYPVDEDSVRRRAGEAFDRSHYQAGRHRHQMAVRFALDRTPDLHDLSLPVLVIHGEDDPLVSVSGGHATADAVPGARLLVLPGMGHVIPEALRPQIVDEVRGLAERAGDLMRPA